MEQPRPTVEQLLKLVDQLTADERARFLEEMQLANVRARLDDAEDSMAQGQGIAGDVFLAELKQRAQERAKKASQ